MHLIWKEQLGYLLHPCIPITDNMKVADVGTGIRSALMPSDCERG